MFNNPGQTPVMEVDQPLFSLAKQLQWNFPQSENGENSFLVTLAALHIEQMLWGVSGDWCVGVGGQQYSLTVVSQQAAKLNLLPVSITYTEHGTYTKYQWLLCICS